MPPSSPPRPPSRRFVVGDVHGHFQALSLLFDSIAPTSADAVYFIGDLIDRGPDSAQVVQFVRENKFHCLLGNHEQMMLDAVGGGQVSPQLLQSWLYTGGYPTLTSYDHHIPGEDIEWMQSLPLYLDLGDAWLVHAGVDPELPLEVQNEEQFCWIRERFHRTPRPYFPDKLIITGHTITFTFPTVEPGKLAAGAGWLDIDTGAYHPKSGWLTAVELNERRVYQVHTNSRKLRQLDLDSAVTFLDPLALAGKRSKRKGWFG
ncbi:MAG: metallophosphoesterase family protein [Cyanobacteriota bacterium]|nr:metallophosphoesterase family protein [Cyanobacteriota bacterium]